MIALGTLSARTYPPTDRPHPMFVSRMLSTATSATIATLLLCSTVRGETLELSKAVVLVAPDATPRERKAVDLLVDEVARRSDIRLPVAQTWPAGGAPVVAVGQSKALKELAGRFLK